VLVDHEAAVPGWRRKEIVGVLILFFLISGATSLVYQVIWMRMLSLVFGATHLATAAVIAAFMTGLALGAAVGGRVADRARNMLLLYGVLELVIGLFALVFPRLLDLSGSVYRSYHHWRDPGFLEANGFNCLMMMVLLLVPTTCMGATLPALCRFVTDRIDEAGQQVGRLYAVNTAGAVLGVWAAGFLLLPKLGLSATIGVTATANLLLGVGAVAVGLRARPRTPAVRDDPGGRTAYFLPIAIAFGLSGLCAMVYEVAWSRFLTLLIGNSVYAFAVMLMAFLAGIAGGSALASRALSRWRVDPYAATIACLAATGASAFVVHHLFGQMPYWFVRLYAIVRYHDSMVWMLQLALACVVMTGPALFLGAMFPVSVRAAVRDPDRVGTDVGRLYTFNTCGAIVGSLLTGFVLIPRLGIRTTLELAVLAGLATALCLVLVWRAPRLRRAAVGGATLALGGTTLLFQPPWDPLLMSAGVYKYVSDLEELTREGVRNYAVSDYELLYYEEGVTTTVTVARAMGDDNIWLANNGKIDASTTVDLPTQVLLGHLGFQFAHDPQRVLIVGLASGISAGSATLYQGPSFDILEIEPAVVTASHFFDHVNQRPLERPGVEMVVNDARNHLFLTPHRYDIIVNQPSNPWISGVSNLYTREYFQMCRDHMVPGGAFVQWMQLYGMGQKDLRAILKTLRDVFPHIILFSSIEEADIIMVASDQPLRFDLDRIAEVLAMPDPREDLARIGIRTAEDLLTYYLMDDVDVADLEGDVPLNTDDNMLIEYSAPRYIHYVTELDNFQLLLEGTSGPWRKTEPLYSDPREKAAFYDRLGQAYFRRNQRERAALAYLRALKLEPGNARYRAAAEMALDAIEDTDW